VAKDKNHQILCADWPQKCLSRDDKLFLRWAWSRSRDIIFLANTC